MRFRKSIKIAPGIKLNFSKSGISSTVGGKGLSVNVGQNGAFLNTGIPGTGISNRTKLDDGESGLERKVTAKDFEAEKLETPFNVSDVEKHRERLLFVAVIFGLLGLFSIPTIWAVISLIVAGVFFLLWNNANKVIKKYATAQAENQPPEEVIEKEPEATHEQPPEKIVPSTGKKYKKTDNGFDKENWKKINEALLRKKEIEARASTVAVEAPDKYQSNSESDIAQAAFDDAMASRVNNVYTKNPICHIIYQKSEGDVSERDIEIKSVETDDFDEPAYVRAFCHMREAVRYFRIDRIKLLSIAGEKIANPKQFFAHLFYNNPDRKTGLAFEEHQDEILLLVFFARADGTMRKKERGIIANYFNSYIDSVPAEFIDNYIKQIQCELSLATILRRAKSMNAETKAHLLDVVSQMYSLKKAPSKIEEGVFEKLKKALSG